jgi:hypothetical protein
MTRIQSRDHDHSGQIAALAHQLGLTPEQLSANHYDLEIHRDDDGVFLGWIVTFRDGPPAGVSIPVQGEGPGAWALVALPEVPDEKLAPLTEPSSSRSGDHD